MAPLPDVSADEAETVIFVDVDGVLNVGVRDSDGVAPLLFNQSNRAFAISMKDQKLKAERDEECKEKLLSVMGRALPPKHQTGRAGDSTYSDLVCAKGSSISDALAAYFAEIIRAAGPQASVVLSSNWRKPAHIGRVRKLEEHVSKHLGSEFKFDGCTPFVEERCAADRLRCIGEHLKTMYAERTESRTPLRILLLEDFFVTPMDGWTCDGSTMDSVTAAEMYLRKQVPSEVDLSLKLVHTYDEWRTASGLRVQVGAGLCEHFTRQALAFLQEPVRQKAHVPATRRLSASFLSAAPKAVRSPSPTTRAGQQITGQPTRGSPLAPPTPPPAPGGHADNSVEAASAGFAAGKVPGMVSPPSPRAQTSPPFADKIRSPVFVNTGASTVDNNRWSRRLRSAVPWLST